MGSLIEKHINRPHQEEMCKKSDIFILPVSLNNEMKYQDCIKILQEYEMRINRWYTKVGRGGDLEALKVPVGGDQLTRVRLQGAKSLRDGAHTPSERSDHLQPMIIEMFHTVQDYIEKLCKKLLNFELSKEIGTLPNLKILIQRDNVNGNVKSRYKAHEDLWTCGIGYLYSYVMSKFQMETLEDFPKHKDIKESINRWTNQHKLKVFHSVMDEILKDLLIPFELEEKEIKVSVSIGGRTVEEGAPVGHMVPIPIVINNVSHSVLSKYFVECIDYIMKTEHTLSPYMSLKVRAGSFVNVVGKPGKNKTADLQKENEVKSLKMLIRSFGANKTEKAITDITKAGPVIQEIYKNFENMTETKTIKSSHKIKSRQKDIDLIIERLKRLKLWENGDNIKLQNKLSTTLFKFDCDMFKDTIMSKVKLLMYDVPVPEGPENEDE